MTSLNEIKLISESLKSAPFAAIKTLNKLIFEDEANKGSRRRIGKFTGFGFVPSSEKYIHKIQFSDKNFNFSEIISVCNILMLDCNLEKRKLIENIVEALNDISSLQTLERDPDDDDEDDPDNDENSELDIRDFSNLRDRSLYETRSKDVSPKFVISFRDVEDSIRTFDGGENYSIERWIEDFEDTAELMNWNDMHKLIFAKKSLRGLAKTFVLGTRGLTTWDYLKESLLEEFAKKVNSAHLHSMLANNKMKKGITAQQFFLEMRELAARGNIDDEALIHYVINGICDDDKYKIMLYGAKTLTDFKQKLKDYECMKKMLCKQERQDYRNEHKKAENTKSKKENDNNQKTEVKKLRCYSCGGIGHKSEDCYFKDKGVRCFRCNKFGHKSFECTTKPIEDKRNTTNTVSLLLPDMLKRLHSKQVTVCGIQIAALIDTGSFVNIIRDDVHRRLGCPELKVTSKNLIGFGGKSVQLSGYFETDILIDEQKFYSKVYVTSKHNMEFEMVIGQELLKHAELVSNAKGITITKLAEDVPFIMNIEVDNSNEISVSENISDKYRTTIKELVTDYKPNKTKEANVKLKILVTDEKPIHASPRRLPFLERDFVQKQVDEWLKEGVIEHCVSDFASPVVIAKKKNGKNRLCIDYRKINKIIVKDKYPLPLMEDVLDRLQEAEIFTTLDLRNGFFHVPVEDESKKYTAFVTHGGHFWFCKAPFGLCNSPSTFQRYVNSVLNDLINQGIVLPYLDDFVIPAKNEEEALNRLKKVFFVAGEYGLDFNFKKCKFLYRKIEFLGHVIENGKIQPSAEKIRAVENYPEPKTIKQVQSFLGLSGYFRKYIKNYSIIAKPLTAMLKKDAKFKFTDLEREAFMTLKKILSEKPVLQIYRQGAHTELHTDASIDGYGFILLQRNREDNKLHPVYYGSRSTTPAEKKYSSYELEVLAVVEALKKFRVYLLGQKFKIVTDCDAFRKTLDKKDLAARVARWVMLLEEYDYEIEHRSGSQMRHVDALSRYPVMEIVDNLLINLANAQEHDDCIRAIKEILKQKPYDDYFLKQNILYKRKNDRELIVVPQGIENQIIQSAHEVGHFATRKTKELIEQDYFINGLQPKIEKYIRNCVTCILVSKKCGKKEGFLQPHFKGDKPLHCYHVDHLGPLQSTSKKYKHIFAVIDAFTKFVWLYPTKSTTSEEVITKLELQSKIFGDPAQIISDRGTAFTSSEFEQYCQEREIEHTLITTGLPRANGQVERLNQIIISVISKLSLDDPTKWYRHVDEVQKVINATYQRSINLSPFELMIGVNMRNQKNKLTVELINQEAARLFVEDREELRSKAKQKIIEIQDENRRTYNLRRKKAIKHEVGDLVAVKRTQFGPGVKLKSNYLGPYKITKVKCNDTYDVEKEGYHEGPFTTTTCAEYIKRWNPNIIEAEEPAEVETSSRQHGRM